MPTVTRMPWVGLLKLLGDGFADGEDRARTVELNERLAAALDAAVPRVLPPPQAAAAVTARHECECAQAHAEALGMKSTLSNGNFTLVSAVLNPCYGFSDQAWARFAFSAPARRVPMARVLPSAVDGCGTGAVPVVSTPPRGGPASQSIRSKGWRCAVRGPHFELGVAGRLDLQQRIDTAIAKVEAGDRLRMTAVEALGQRAGWTRACGPCSRSGDGSLAYSSCDRLGVPRR